MARRLLIVDDEPTLRWCLGRFFSVSGFSVSSAATLQEALDASPQSLPALVSQVLALASPMDS